jgi:hypothetical protein
VTKVLLISVVLLSVALVGCIPDLATPFMQGMETARRANEDDRQQGIAFAINNFNQTGDYRALCYAAMLGSREASNYLLQSRVGCQVYEQGGQKYIEAVQL